MRKSVLGERENDSLMVDDKTVVCTALEEGVERVINIGFEDSRAVTIERDGWYPHVKLRVEDTPPTSLAAVFRVHSETEADYTVAVGEEEWHYKQLSDASLKLEDTLTDAGFSILTYNGVDSGVFVHGWKRSPPWFRDGDLIKLFKWKTPLKVTHVCSQGERPPEEFPLPVTPELQYIGPETLHLCLAGRRGGEHLIDYDGEQASLYQRAQSEQPVLKKTNEEVTTVFTGNPTTGPRLEDTEANATDGEDT